MTTPRKTWSVLMVDDNPAMREAIARSLARRGCAVTTATDAAEALASLRRQSCDVVVTDLNMPEHGGLWLWRQAMIVRPELRGRFVLIASEPLPDPRSMDLFLESERFVHFHRRDADTRLVISHNCVIPKNNAAALFGGTRFVAS